MRVAFVVRKLKFEELLGIAYLAAVARDAGHATCLFDAANAGCLPAVRRYQPAVIAFSTVTNDEPFYRRLNREMKRRFSYYSVWGGPHPTFVPEIIADPDIDAVCRGEGEIPFRELLDALACAQPVPAIAGLWLRRADGTIQRNPMPARLPDLEALPFPDRELFYRCAPALRRQRMLRVMTARGCPYHCTYCFNDDWRELQPASGPGYRRRRVAQVIAEIAAARTGGKIAAVQFIDDTFNLDRQWLREFAELYPAQVGLPFQCNVRPDLIDDEVAGLLKRAGCAFVSTGIEAGNDRVRQDLLRRAISRERLLAAAAALRRAGIAVKTESILGLPDSTWEEDWETVQLNRELRPAAATASIFQPYPGTALAARAIARGSFDGDYAGLGDNYFHYAPLLREPLDRRRRLNLQAIFNLLVWLPALPPGLRQLLSWPCYPLLRLAGLASELFTLGRLLPVAYSLSDRFILAWRFVRLYYR